MFQGLGLMSGSRVIFLNKDQFEEYGLPNLYEIVEDQKWTWETLLEIAKQATRDTTGDGEFDVWGFGPGTSGRIHQIEEFMYTNRANIADFVDGQVTARVTEPNFIDTLEFLHDLHEFQPEELEYNRAESIAMGETLMGLATTRDLAPGRGLVDHLSEEKVAAIGMVPLPMGPAHDRYFYYTGYQGNAHVAPALYYACRRGSKAMRVFHIRCCGIDVD